MGSNILEVYTVLSNRVSSTLRLFNCEWTLLMASCFCIFQFVISGVPKLFLKNMLVVCLQCFIVIGFKLRLQPLANRSALFLLVKQSPFSLSVSVLKIDKILSIFFYIKFVLYFFSHTCSSMHVSSSYSFCLISIFISNLCLLLQPQ